MAVGVSTEVYQGPFDLLLQLILKEQVDLYEVDLASIVDAYLTEVERMQALDLEVATEFLLIAATLVELKTRRLLPGSGDVDLDEELALWEERDLLLARALFVEQQGCRLSCFCLLGLQGKACVHRMLHGLLDNMSDGAIQRAHAAALAQVWLYTHFQLSHEAINGKRDCGHPTSLLPHGREGTE